MADYKYIAEYTDKTTIETVHIHGGLTKRTYNVLSRGGVKTIGELKKLKSEDIHRFRNAGRYTVEECEKFIGAYKARLIAPAPSEQKRLISADELIAYCNKCAETAQELADKILGKVGLGESEISALGGAAYFLQQARMYRFDIPNAIECVLKEMQDEPLY